MPETHTPSQAETPQVLPLLPPGFTVTTPPVPPAPAWWLRLYGPTGEGDPIALEVGR